MFYEAQEIFTYLNTILHCHIDRFQGNCTSYMVAQYVKHRQCLELIQSSEEIIFHRHLIRPNLHKVKSFLSCARKIEKNGWNV